MIGADRPELCITKIRASTTAGGRSLGSGLLPQPLSMVRRILEHLDSSVEGNEMPA
mgnify:FL=1